MSNGPGLKTSMFTTGVPRNSLFLSCKGRSLYYLSTDEKRVMHLIQLFCFAGVIGNTRPLNYSVSHSYVLSVVAHDCGGKESRPLLITVEVKHACNTGWSGKLRQPPTCVLKGNKDAYKQDYQLSRRVTVAQNSNQLFFLSGAKTKP